MRTLILGLGNPLLSDDGVGWRVARGVYEAVKGEGIDLVESSAAGLGLLDLMEGYDRVILIDAIKTAGGKVGSLYQLGLDDLRSTPRLASPHDVDLALALEMGRALGTVIPTDLKIYAVEVEDPYTFGEELTPSLQEAVPTIINEIAKSISPRNSAPGI
ncbi:MAG: hydrogenase maturation protease [Chloroflexi bacterium]|nr:hydrogenase maturation protease [Chloroflexota bacterium]MCL5075193.1 hydrogenase maturation protease [Chloroflexota bacterium]